MKHSQEELRERAGFVQVSATLSVVFDLVRDSESYGEAMAFLSGAYELRGNFRDDRANVRYQTFLNDLELDVSRRFISPHKLTNYRL